MIESQIQLEVCVGSVADALAAFDLGADRVELNAALSLGGLTPTPTTVARVREHSRGELIVMNRPRSGNFIYSDVEFEVMLGDVNWMLEHGAQGIAFGFLTIAGTIDLAATERMVAAVGDATSVFHRAFDLLDDQDAALRQLIDCGVDRVLTSGGEKTAIEGAEALRGLQESAAGRIEILPASGIRPDNVRQLIEVTGCTQVHASLSRVVDEAAFSAGAANVSPAIQFVDELAIDESKRREFDLAAMEKMLASLERPAT